MDWLNRAPTSAPLLIRVGEALYGSRWQTDLAEGLGVSSRTVRRWIAEPKTMPDGALADLRRLVAARQDLLAVIAEQLG